MSRHVRPACSHQCKSDESVRGYTATMSSVALCQTSTKFRWSSTLIFLLRWKLTFTLSRALRQAGMAAAVLQLTSSLAMKTSWAYEGQSDSLPAWFKLNKSYCRQDRKLLWHPRTRTASQPLFSRMIPLDMSVLFQPVHLSVIVSLAKVKIHFTPKLLLHVFPRTTFRFTFMYRVKRVTRGQIKCMY